MEDEKNKVGKLDYELNIDVNNSNTIQTILDNANASKELYHLTCLISRYSEFQSKENLSENFHEAIPCFDDANADFIFRIINGLIEENKKLKK